MGSISEEIFISVSNNAFTNEKLSYNTGAALQNLIYYTYVFFSEA